MRGIVLFLVFLVLSIPFSSTLVLATALGEPYRPASGSFEQILVSDNTHKKNPLIDRALPNSNAVIQVVLPQSAADPSQLTFASIAFQSCLERAGKSLCTLSLPPTICSGNLQYQSANYQLEFIIDGTTPSLETIAINSSTTVISQTINTPIPVISPKKISLHYQGLNDNADFAQNDCGSCSGVRSLRIFQGPPSQNKKVGEVFFTPAVEDLLSGSPGSACALPDATVDVDLTLAVTGEEEVVLYAQVCDALAHCSSKLVSTMVMIDNRAPQINTTFRDATDQETYLYQQNVPFSIEAQISDISGIDPASVQLDIAQFDPLSEPLLETEAHTDITIVRWRFIAQSPTPPTSYTVTVADKAGNAATHTKILNLGEDKEAPIIVSLRTERFFEGISYIGRTANGRTNIITEISDDRAGVIPSTVTFDLAQLGLSSRTNPDSCSKMSSSAGKSSWQCHLSIPTPATEGSFTISASAQDLLGNTVAEQKSATVVVDLSSPTNVKIVPTLEHPTPADARLFAFDVSAQDASPLELFSTFSSVSTGGNVTVRCRKDESCQIAPKNLRALVGDALVDIEVRDLAGNKAAEVPSQRVTLLQIQDCRQQPITISLGDANTVLNKRIASKVPYEIYFPIRIDGLNRNVQAGDLHIERCDALAGAFTALIDPQSSYIVGPSKSALLFTKIKTKPGPGSAIEDLEINCEISASVVLNGKKCAQPVIMKVTGKIRSTEAPIGDIGVIGRQELDAVQSRINSLDKSIKSYEHKMEALNLWCNVAETANNIQNAMSTLLSGVQILSCALYAVPFAQGAAQGLYTGTCVPTQVVTQITDYVLWSKSYIPYGPKVVGVTSKYACMIRKCVLCDLEEVFNVGLGIATEVVALSDPKIEGDEANKAGERLSRDDKGNIQYESDSFWANALTESPVDSASGGVAQVQEVWHVGGGSSRIGFGGYQTPQEQLAAKEAGEFSKKVWNLKKPGADDLFKISTAGAAAELSVEAESGDADKWTWDPYRSIHYARACYCFNGIVFNMKKERDIYCMYKECLQQSLSEGLPTTACAIDKKIQQCLFVDSAYYKKYGFNFWENLFDALLRFLEYYIIMLGFEAVCGWTYGQSIDCAAIPCAGFWKSTCNLAGVALSIRELNVFNTIGDNFDASKLFSSDDPNALRYEEKC